MDPRLVSRDALEARPITQGKSPPSTAWGTTLQMPFNRQGFLMTPDHCMGQPNATTLSGPTLPRLRERLHAYPGTAVTDLGFRSANHRTRDAPHLDHVLMGRSLEVDAAQQEAWRKARAATEGFRAVATHLRGCARRLSRGLQGALLWPRLGQCASNGPKFLQRYRAEALEASTLIKLRLSSIAPAGAWAAVERPPHRDGLARCPPPVRPHMAATGPDGPMLTLTPSKTLSDEPICSHTCSMDHLMISQCWRKSADITYILFEAISLGAPRTLLLRMVANIALDTLVISFAVFPILGG